MGMEIPSHLHNSTAQRFKTVIYKEYKIVYKTFDTASK